MKKMMMRSILSGLFLMAFSFQALAEEVKPKEELKAKEEKALVKKEEKKEIKKEVKKEEKKEALAAPAAPEAPAKK